MIEFISDFFNKKHIRAKERGDTVWTDEQGRTFTKSKSSINDRKPSETHPSYATISIGRVSGSPGKLVGSQLKEHNGFFSLKINTASIYFSGYDEEFFAEYPIIEVILSAAQFAEAITTLNVHSGVPCTLYRLMGESIPKPPQDILTEHEKIQVDFGDRQKEIIISIKNKMEKIRKMFTEKKSISKTDRSIVLDLLNRVLMDIESNQPFQLQCFQEAVERTTTYAKAEIDAMFTLALQKAGVKAIKAREKEKLLK